MDDLLAPRHGLTVRALTVDDVDAVITLANTCELHDVSYTMWEREDLTSDLRLPHVDPELDSIGVFGKTGIFGWGFMPQERRAWVDVHPDVRGRGIGTWLRRWTERRARDGRAARVWDRRSTTGRPTRPACWSTPATGLAAPHGSCR